MLKSVAEVATDGMVKWVRVPVLNIDRSSSSIKTLLKPVYLGEGIARGPRVAKLSTVGMKSGAPRGCIRGFH